MLSQLPTYLGTYWVQPACSLSWLKIQSPETHNHGNGASNTTAAMFQPLSHPLKAVTTALPSQVTCLQDFTDFFFSAKTLVSNNLAGVLSGEKEMRFQHAGDVGGQKFDFVVGKPV